MKKKILSVLLAVLILTAMLTTSLVAFAASATYNVGVKTDGKTMEVTVTLPGSAKAAGGNFTLQYNKDRLTYSKTEGTVIGSFNGNYRDNAVRLSFSSPNAYTSDTQLVKIIFTVKNGKASASDISLPAYKVYDENSTNIGDETKGSAKITFTCSHSKTADKITKNPACTTAGEKQIVCSVCDAVIKTESIPATGHSFGAWTVTKAATCTEKGTETRTCSCGAKETRDIAVKSHTAGNWTVKTAPTCEGKGTEVQKCTACGTELNTREIAAKGHTFGEWNIVKDATCTEKGEKKSVCTVCGKAVTEEIAAKGHTPGEWTVIKDATCTEKGEKKSVCTVCGVEFKEEIPAKGHTPSEWAVVKEATCTTDGEKKSVCTVCGEEYTEAIPALGHKFGEWKTVTEATDKAEGKEERVCSVCGEKETKVIPVLPKSEDPKKPVIPNTAENTAVYAVVSVLGVTALFAIVGVSVYKLRKKQLIEN